METTYDIVPYPRDARFNANLRTLMGFLEIIRPVSLIFFSEK